MSNPFDKFDAAQSSAPKNPFDQFDNADPVAQADAYNDELNKRMGITAQAPASSSEQSGRGFFNNALRGAGERAADLGAGLLNTMAAGVESAPRGGFAPGYVGQFVTPEQDAKNKKLAADAFAGGADSLRATDLDYDEKRNTLDGAKAKYGAGQYLGAAAELFAAGNESMLTSAPDMVGAVGALPVYVAARTGEIANERAKNKGLERPTQTEINEAAPFALASSLLERILPGRVLRGAGELSEQAAKEISDGAIRYVMQKAASETGKSALIEGGTEFVQEGIIEYIGQRYGTDAAMDANEAMAQGVEAAILGGIGGGTIGAAKGGYDGVSDVRRSGGHVNQDSDVDQPMNGEQLGGGIVDDLPQEAATQSEVQQLGYNPERMVVMPDGTTAWESELPALAEQSAAAQHPGYARITETPDQVEASLAEPVAIDDEINSMMMDLDNYRAERVRQAVQPAMEAPAITGVNPFDQFDEPQPIPDTNPQEVQANEAGEARTPLYTGIPYLADNEAALPQSQEQTIPALRSERDSSLPEMAEQFSGISGRRGDEAFSGINAGEGGQRQRLRAGERDLGNPEGASAKPQEQFVSGIQGGAEAVGGVGGAIGNPLQTSEAENSDLQVGSRASINNPGGLTKAEQQNADAQRFDKANEPVGEGLGNQLQDAQKQNQRSGVERGKGAGAVGQSTYESIDTAANEAATSPLNDLPEPTDAQKAAGNYKLGRVKLHGFDIAIENPRGSTRSGVDPDGKPWTNKLHSHYGYIQKTEASDGDAIDVFVGPNPASEKVFVVDQINKDGSFDEVKVLFGFDSKLRARSGYKSNYSNGWKVGPITSMTMGEFKEWVKSGDTKKPLASTISDEIKTPSDSSALSNEKPATAVSDEISSGNQAAGKEREVKSDSAKADEFAETLRRNAKANQGTYKGKPLKDVALDIANAAIDTGRRLSDSEIEALSKKHEVPASVIKNLASSPVSYDYILARAEAKDVGALALKQRQYEQSQNQQPQPSAGVSVSGAGISAEDAQKLTADLKRLSRTPDFETDGARYPAFAKRIEKAVQGDADAVKWAKEWLSDSDENQRQQKASDDAQREAADSKRQADEKSAADTESERLAMFYRGEIPPGTQENYADWVKSLPDDERKMLFSPEASGGKRNAAFLARGKGATKVKPAYQRPESEVQYQSELPSRLRSGEVGIDEFKAAFNSLTANREGMEAELSKLTKDKLIDLITGYSAIRAKGEKKAYAVRAAYESLITQYYYAASNSSMFSYSGGGKDYIQGKIDSVRPAVDAATQENLDAYAKEYADAIQEREENKKRKTEGMQDPKTLEDFRNLHRSILNENENMSQADARMQMSVEQRAEYDRLSAIETRVKRIGEKAERKAQVSSGDQLVSGSIIETKHTKKGHDLFVVQLDTRVSKDDYTTLAASAKKLGGYYSNFRGGGAVPGFQFTTSDDARAFLDLAGGNTEAASEIAKEKRDAFEDDKSQSTAERLRTMAAAMRENAENELSRDRKSNTQRRAGMAARALDAAEREKAMAETMVRIADGIESGELTFLDKLRTKAQLSQIQAALHVAKGDETRKKYESYAEQLKHEGEPITAETVDYAAWPTYTAYRSDLAKLARQMIETDGLKKLGNDLLKVADDTSAEYQQFAKDNLNKVATFQNKDGALAVFKTKKAAALSIEGSGFSGKAIPFEVKRGEHLIILSPSEAAVRGIWSGADKKITLTPDFVEELIEKAAKKNRKKENVSVPWQFETAYEKRQRYKSMGIETAAEFRAALREYVGIAKQPGEMDKVKKLELAMVGRKKDGLDFFPTPQAVADEMINAAGIQAGMSVLEPSAGMGHIADRIRAFGVEPDVVEISSERRELLEAKGYKLVGMDFIEYTNRDTFGFGDTFRAEDGSEGILRGQGGLGSDRVRLVDENGEGVGKKFFSMEELTPVRKNGAGSGYDRIIMNPPFSDRRDMEHVLHAYDLLKPGGRIVAIVGEGVMFGSDKKATEFRAWLDELGATAEKLEEGTFNDPSLPVTTGVNARMLVIDKPESGDVRYSLKKESPPVDQTETPAFKKWFGDSKVVDENGKPRVMYHGTGADINAFKDNKKGIFFGSDPVTASSYSKIRGGNPNVIPVYLSIANPWTFVRYAPDVPYAQQIDQSIENLRKQGYDGAFRPEDSVWVAFDPEQIKSATGNNGDFDSSNPDIRYKADSTETPSITRDAAQAVVDRIAENWAVDVEVKLVSSADDLPAEIRERMKKDGKTIDDVQALFHPKTGKVFLNANSLTDAEHVEILIFHEVYTHMGLQALFGDALTGTLSRLYLALGGRAGIKKIAEKHNIDLSKYDKLLANESANYRHSVIAEELLAHLSEDTKPSIAKYAKEAIGAIRAWLRKNGFAELSAISESDLVYLLKQARETITKGKQGDTDGLVYALAGLSKADRKAINAERDQVKYSLGRDSTREQLKLKSGRNKKGKPVFINDDLAIVGDRQLAVPDSEFSPDNELPMGHLEHVEGGAEMWAMAVGVNGKKIATLKVQIKGGAISAIHDISVIRSQRGSGVGEKIVAALLATNSNPVRIIEAIPSAKAFWSKMGANGFFDLHNNTTIGWADYASNRARRAEQGNSGKPAGDGKQGDMGQNGQRDGQANSGRSDLLGLGDSYTDDEKQFFQDNGIKYSLAGNGQQTRPSGGFSFGRSKIKRGATLPHQLKEAYNQLGGGQKTLYEKVKTEVKRQLAPRGLLPREIFDLKIARDGAMNADDSQQRFILTDFYTQVEEVYKKPYTELKAGTRKEINDYLKGDRTNVQLTPSMIEVLGRMRTQIQSLSRSYMDQLLLDAANLESQGKNEAAATKRALIETITDNFDNYLHRSYRAFDDPEWPNKVPEDVYQNAVNFLAKQYAKDAHIKGYVASRKAERKAATSKAKREAFERKYYENHAKIKIARDEFELAKAELAEAKKRLALADLAGNRAAYKAASVEVDKLVLTLRAKNKTLLAAKREGAAVARQKERDAIAGSVTPTADHIDKATKKVDLMLHEGTAYDSIGRFISESKLGSKDLSMIKKRKQIAPEIRALLGEYEDPAINYAKSVTKMTRLVHNTAFLRQMTDVAADLGLLFDEENRPLGANKKIAGDASEVYSPLNGMYTYPEFEQALRDAVGSSKEPDWYKVLVAANGAVKYGKTVLAPTTAARNFMSASMFALTSGHWNVTHLEKSVKVIKTYFTGKDVRGSREYVNKLLELGVLYDAPNYRELQDLIKSVNESEHWLAKATRKSKLGAVLNYAQEFYALGDDFWKILGFENEKAMLIKHYGMTEAAAEKEAAERIRNTYPTYSLTGKGIQALRRFPVIGSFPSFPAEIIRTTYHKFRYLHKDGKALGYGNPSVVAKGIGIVLGAGMMAGLSALSAAMFGVDDEEEEAIRQMLPEWSKNSSLFFLGRDEKGQVQYMDLGWIDPYGYWKKPLSALARDGSAGEKMGDAAWEALSPFLGLDIAVGTIGEYVYDSFFNGSITTEKATEKLVKGLAPGVVNNALGFWEAANETVTKSGKKYTFEDEALALVGFRKGTLNAKVGLTYQAYGYSDKKRQAATVLRDKATDLGKVDIEELRAAYEKSMRMQRSAWDDMRRTVKMAMKTGMPAHEAVAALRTSGMSAQDARGIVADREFVYRPSKAMMKLAIRRTGILFDKEAQDELRERQKRLQELQREYLEKPVR